MAYTLPIYNPSEHTDRLFFESRVDFGGQRCVVRPIHIVQYDKTMPVVEVSLFKNGATYTLPQAVTAVRIRWGKKDHTFIIKDILGISSDGRKAYFEVDEQMTFFDGVCNPILELRVGSNVIAGSSPIPFEIDRNPVQLTDIESHVEYPGIVPVSGTGTESWETITIDGVTKTVSGGGGGGETIPLVDEFPSTASQGDKVLKYHSEQTGTQPQWQRATNLIPHTIYRITFTGTYQTQVDAFAYVGSIDEFNIEFQEYEEKSVVSGMSLMRVQPSKSRVFIDLDAYCAQLAGVEVGRYINPSGVMVCSLGLDASSQNLLQESGLIFEEKIEVPVYENVFDGLYVYDDFTWKKVNNVDLTPYATKTELTTGLAGKLSPSDIIDGVSSTATNKALSAKQGKVLNDRIDNLQSIGRFLAIWNCVTGLPTSNPSGYPYAYHTGDYFRVGTVGDVNYMPNGSSYEGTASTTVYTGDIATGDIFFYDGSSWNIQINHASESIQDVKVDGTSVVTGKVANIDLTGKQDLLTSDNAGDNITITNVGGVPKISATSGTPSNMVTTDTAQTITGLKTINSNLKINAYSYGIGFMNSASSNEGWWFNALDYGNYVMLAYKYASGDYTSYLYFNRQIGEFSINPSSSYTNAVINSAVSKLQIATSAKKAANIWTEKINDSGWLANASVADSTLTITKSDGTTVTFAGGGGTPSNMVTTDTGALTNPQVITGWKRFTGGVKIPLYNEVGWTGLIFEGQYGNQYVVGVNENGTLEVYSPTSSLMEKRRLSLTYNSFTFGYTIENIYVGQDNYTTLGNSSTKLKDLYTNKINGVAYNPVSGINDGTNWTSLTIGNATYNIPAGGGGSSEANIKDVSIAPTETEVDLSTLEVSKEGQTYGWVYDSLYGLCPENSATIHGGNTGQSFGYGKISLHFDRPGTITFTVQQSVAYPYYQYMFISKLDTMLGRNYYTESSAGFDTYNLAEGTEKTYTVNVPAGDHFLTMKFIRYNSTTVGGLDMAYITSITTTMEGKVIFKNLDNDQEYGVITDENISKELPSNVARTSGSNYDNPQTFTGYNIFDVHTGTYPLKIITDYNTGLTISGSQSEDVNGMMICYSGKTLHFGYQNSGDYTSIFNLNRENSKIGFFATKFTPFRDNYTVFGEPNYKLKDVQTHLLNGNQVPDIIDVTGHEVIDISDPDNFSKEEQTYGFVYGSFYGYPMLYPEAATVYSSRIFSYGKFPFTAKANGTKLRLIVDAQDSWQYSTQRYIIISKLDTELSKDYNNDSSSSYEYSSYNLSNPVQDKEIIIDNIPAGEHYITFKFGKSSSSYISQNYFTIKSIEIIHGPNGDCELQNITQGINYKLVTAGHTLYLNAMDCNSEWDAITLHYADGTSETVSGSAMNGTFNNVVYFQFAQTGWTSFNLDYYNQSGDDTNMHDFDEHSIAIIGHAIDVPFENSQTYTQRFIIEGAVGLEGAVGGDRRRVCMLKFKMLYDCHLSYVGYDY